MTCKECIWQRVCKNYRFFEDMTVRQRHNESKIVEKECHHFSNDSSIVSQKYKIGDSAYFVYPKLRDIFIKKVTIGDIFIDEYWERRFVITVDDRRLYVREKDLFKEYEEAEEYLKLCIEERRKQQR